MTGQNLEKGEIQNETGPATIISSQSSDLAKLNPICHMNYSAIFTEISFYLETLSLFWNPIV